MNRPEKLNALTLQLQEELNEALWEADNNNDVHCVIIKGAGRAFSAGYDLTGAGGNVPVSRVQSEENDYRKSMSPDDDEAKARVLTGTGSKNRRSATVRGGWWTTDSRYEKEGHHGEQACFDGKKRSGLDYHYQSAGCAKRG